MSKTTIILLTLVISLASACQLPSTVNPNAYGSVPIDLTDGVVTGYEAVLLPIVADYPGERGIGHEQDMVVGEAVIWSWDIDQPLMATLYQYDGFGDGDEYTTCTDDACNVRVPLIAEVRTMDETYEVGDMVCVAEGLNCQFYSAHWFVIVAG